MAKKKTAAVDQPVRDLSIWYTDTAFMPEDVKESRVWFAQSLFYAKLNSQPLVDARRVAGYRKAARLQIDEQVYRNILDPVTPGNKGGTAEYVAADFKANPIYIHTENILRAKLDKIALINNIQVNEIDKFAKSQRQLEKDKTIHLREFRKLINEINKEVGLPPIKESESPYDYAKQLAGDNTGQKVDDISRLMENIRMKVVDDKDWALYDTYVYKGDIERAFELGIKHYLINQNKWSLKSELFIDDLKNFNHACGKWTIDETTGRGLVYYISPEQLFTNTFYQKDGSDLMYWFHEDDIPFSDFVRQFGTTLTDQQLKEVFELNKYSGAAHNMNWTATATKRRDTSKIRVGYYSVLTQEDNNFSEEYMASNQAVVWERKPISWKPDTDSSTQKRKIYNVWYSGYYIPPPGDRLQNNSQAGWQWQSQFIFNMKKNTEMYRYGVDMRYARSELVIWKDERPSFMDVAQEYMTKIHTIWHKFQNSLIQDTSALLVDFDLIGGLLNAVDEGNKINPDKPNEGTGGNGLDAGMQAWRALKQGGMALVKFRDKNGNMIVQDIQKLFGVADNGQLAKAEKYLELILQLYSHMTISLAQNDVTQGILPKPRTAASGIEAALEAANDGMWFVEKPVREFVIMYAERCVQHILAMVKEKKKYGYEERWREFSDVVGLAQALMLEGIEDLNPEDIGLTVSLEDTTAMREYIFTLADSMAKANMVSWQAAGLVINTLHTGSWKYAYALLMLSMNEQERKNDERANLEHQRQMELLQQQGENLKAAQALKTQGALQEIGAEGQVDAMLQDQMNKGKYQSQSAIQQQRGNLKMMENAQKSELKKEENQPQPIAL